MRKQTILSHNWKIKVLVIIPFLALILYAFTLPVYRMPVSEENNANNVYVSSDQKNVVKGVVLQQSGAPLIGASVVVKGTTIGTTTNPRGYFRLSNIPAGVPLVVSYVGFTGMVVKPDYSSDMKLTMVRDTLGIFMREMTVSPPPPPPPPPTAGIDISNKPESGRPRQEGRDDKFVVVEEFPSFPGGHEALTQWMVNNFRYPEEAVRKEITGDVMVIFEVTETGSIKGVKVAKPVHPLLDAEAVRLISSMPSWNPGRQNGKPAGVIMKIPVRFRFK